MHRDEKKIESGGDGLVEISALRGMIQPCAIFAPGGFEGHAEDFCA